MFGKWHLGDNYPYRPEDRGYTEVLRHGGGGVGQTPDYWDNAYFDGSYWHNGQPESVNGFCTDVFFDYAKRFVKDQKAKGQPFLAYIATNAPHGPMHAPEASSKPYQDQNVNLANFFGMIANIDDNVGSSESFSTTKASRKTPSSSSPPITVHHRVQVSLTTACEERKGANTTAATVSLYSSTGPKES